jgi:photosystem II stability/assembly factor-like uncharacterized protein
MRRHDSTRRKVISERRNNLQRQLLFLSGAIVTLLGMSAAQTTPGWSWLHPTPQGNPVRWVKVFDANIWYVFGNSGLFAKTTNAGATWNFQNNVGTQNSTGRYSDNYAAWFFDQATGFVGGSGRNLLKTTNGGATFQDHFDLGASAGIVQSIFFLNSNVGFFCGTTPMKAYKTSDGGASWMQLAALPVANYHSVYTRDGNTVFVGSTLGNLYKSSDGGLTWTVMNLGSSVANFYGIAFRNAREGVVVGSVGFVRFTTDGGITWTNNTLPSTSNNYDVHFDSTACYLVGDTARMFKTTDLGTTWTSITVKEGTLAPFGMLNLDVNGSTWLISGFAGQMYKSVNGGASWTAMWRGQIANLMYDVSVESMRGNIWLAGSNASGGGKNMLYSSNGGTTWEARYSGSSATIFAIKMVNSSVGYICGTGMVRKTTDGGTTWDSVGSPTTSLQYSLDFVDANTGWIFGSSGNFYKTTNGGASWTAQPIGTTATVYRGVMFNANVGYAVGSLGYVGYTSNGGAMWTTRPTGTTTTTFRNIKVLDANTAIVVGSAGLMLKTTNTGTTWETIPTPLGNQWTGCDWVSANVGIVGDIPGTLAKTTDGGQNWTLWFPTANAMYQVVMRHPDSALAIGSSATVLRYPATSPPTEVRLQWNRNVPADFRLEQNYPNPFNPSTTIRFAIPKAARVALQLFDVTGKELESPLAALDANAGTFTVTFDASRYAAGVYFFSLNVDGKAVATRRMALVK